MAIPVSRQNMQSTATDPRSNIVLCWPHHLNRVRKCLCKVQTLKLCCVNFEECPNWQDIGFYHTSELSTCLNLFNILYHHKFHSYFITTSNSMDSNVRTVRTFKKLKPIAEIPETLDFITPFLPSPLNCLFPTSRNNQHGSLHTTPLFLGDSLWT